MRASPGRSGLFASSILRPLFLLVFLLHEFVAESEAPDPPGSKVCQAGGIARQDVGAEPSGVCEDSRGSLLQVSSKRHALPSIGSSPRSEPVVNGSPPRSEPSVHRGSHIALTQSTELVRKTALKPSVILLVVLVIFAVACILMVVVHNVNDSFNKQDEGKRGEDATAQRWVNASQSAQRTSAGTTPPTSLPATPGQRQLRPVMMQSRPGSSPGPLGLPAQEGVVIAGVKHLCPGLVVPHGNECILAVPSLRLPTRTAAETDILNVQDLDGKSVIQVEVAIPRPAQGGASVTPRPLVTLRAGPAPLQQEQSLLAYSKAALDPNGRKKVCIYDARNQAFADIIKDRVTSRYVLTSERTNLKIFFVGDILKHTVSVENDKRDELAQTTPEIMGFDRGGNYYRLRVVSNVDVGLMICALFSMDLMELA